MRNNYTKEIVLSNQYVNREAIYNVKKGFAEFRIFIRNTQDFWILLLREEVFSSNRTTKRHFEKLLTTYAYQQLYDYSLFAKLVFSWQLQLACSTLLFCTVYFGVIWKFYLLPPKHSLHESMIRFNLA